MKQSALALRAGVDYTMSGLKGGVTMKKTYEAPVIVSESVQIGVFGCYSGGTGSWTWGRRRRRWFWWWG